MYETFSQIQVMREDQELRGAEPFTTNQPGLVPPLVTTSFIVQDEGNVNPRFMRSTMYSVPCAIDMMKQVCIVYAYWDVASYIKSDSRLKS